MPLSEDDLARLPLPTKHTITVVGFIEPQGVVPISYDRPYYIAPAGGDADRPVRAAGGGPLQPGSWPWPRSRSATANAGQWSARTGDCCWRLRRRQVRVPDLAAVCPDTPGRRLAVLTAANCSE
ncbi:Ku protein [Streptomyces coeruleorubidus]|uniref:Ku protein n=1 Tax=Streptomyces coeruleorubidus TaxID=116188 RepID=UPI0036FBF1B3